MMLTLTLMSGTYMDPHRRGTDVFVPQSHQPRPCIAPIKSASHCAIAAVGSSSTRTINVVVAGYLLFAACHRSRAWSRFTLTDLRAALTARVTQRDEPHHYTALVLMPTDAMPLSCVSTLRHLLTLRPKAPLPVTCQRAGTACFRRCIACSHSRHLTETQLNED
jgi:hypothetical protein